MRSKFISGLLIFTILFILSCKKNPGDPAPQPPANHDTIPAPPHEDPNPVDPETANTIGFFLDNWMPKSFTIPDFKDTSIPSSSSVTVNIDAGTIITKIPNSISGQNANIWMSQIVTESLLMKYLTDLKPPIIRLPGGSLSDMYFWNAPKGTPPADAPSTLKDASGADITADIGMGKIMIAGPSLLIIFTMCYSKPAARP